MNPYLFLVLASVMFLAFSVQFFSSWWFDSKNQVKINRKKRRELRKNPIFILQSLLLFDIYDRYPQSETWLGRILGIALIACSIIGIAVAIASFNEQK